uniref:DUF6598 domain-containing protein n=1 Tax=Arundo donax TaxID=35708 RepID=A0A0A9CTS9_ARUDO
MQSLLRSTLRICRRPSVGSVACGAPRWCPPGLARRDPPPMPAASAQPDKLLDRVSEFAFEPWNIQHSIRIRSSKEDFKLDRTTKGTDEAEMDEETKHVHDNNFTVTNVIWPASILENSSHRDGAIYKENWEACYLIDIADRTETEMDLKKLTDPISCYPDWENCIAHWPSAMMQIFSLSLARTPINNGSIQLYGYMAVRDDLDGLLNYVFNRSRDDPVIVQQGSLLEMTGPKRGILMLSEVIFEFDMRIKTGEKEENDAQLIDGLLHYDDRMTHKPLTVRINGNCGAVDKAFKLVEKGVEAVIEVAISKVQSAFDLSLSSFVSVMEVRKEIQLFHGAAGELGIKRSVVAVPMYTMMDLKFKAGQKGSDSDIVRYCCFSAEVHGCASRQIKLELACVSVKVTWSPPLF